MNGDGQINLDGADRVTRTVHEYGPREGLTVQRTLTYVWPESGKDSPQLVSSQETSLNGQLYTVVWRSQNGLTRQTRATLLGQGVRLVTEIEPDGSLALSASHQGRVLSVTRQDGKGARMFGAVDERLEQAIVEAVELLEKFRRCMQEKATQTLRIGIRGEAREVWEGEVRT